MSTKETKKKLTIIDLYHQLKVFVDNASEEAKKKPVVAKFDFPIHGAVERYQISSFNVNGEIVLRNLTCDRPLGHE